MPVARARAISSLRWAPYGRFAASVSARPSSPKILAATPGTPSDFGIIVPGFYAVTASEDGTTVDLSALRAPASSVKAGGGVQADGTGQIMLNARRRARGLLRQTTGGNPSTADVTGTRVKADKPIQVIGGHMCTYVPLATPATATTSRSRCFPYETLAKEYIVTPPLIPTGGNVPKAQMVRIVATEDDTNLTYDPPQHGAPANIAKAGAYIEISTRPPPTSRSPRDKKIIIAQYHARPGRRRRLGRPRHGPRRRHRAVSRQTYLFHAPINYETNYAQRRRPHRTPRSPSTAPPVDGFKRDRRHRLRRRPRQARPTTSTATTTSPSDKPFGISVYGYGQYTSYWYPGGLDLEPLPQ
ncbi:MAG: IgGFc-binding protein [Bifidobacterium adolescentis]